jgi:hypothetical protein
VIKSAGRGTAPAYDFRLMSEYTEDEKQVLLAGMIGGRERDDVWNGLPEAIQSLGERGLVRIGREAMADGTMTSFPLCLSPTGVLEARRLQEVSPLTSGY